MKLREPFLTEPRFAAVINDCDADGPTVTFFHTQKEAEDHIAEQYGDIPSVDETCPLCRGILGDFTCPECAYKSGNTYEAGERPNAACEVVEVFLVRVLKRVLL